MSCSCIKGNFDFLITPIDTRNFRYTDLSEWMSDDPYVIPPTYPIEIILPNGNKNIIHVKPNDDTIINASSFGSLCLSDGTYCFTVKECKNCDQDYKNFSNWGGREYTKQVAIIARLNCRIKNIIASEDTDIQKGIELTSKLDQIKIISQTGQTKKAAELYSMLDREVKKHNCNECDC